MRHFFFTGSAFFGEHRIRENVGGCTRAPQKKAILSFVLIFSCAMRASRSCHTIFAIHITVCDSFSFRFFFISEYYCTRILFPFCGSHALTALTHLGILSIVLSLFFPHFNRWLAHALFLCGADIYLCACFLLKSKKKNRLFIFRFAPQRARVARWMAAL